MPKCPNCRTEYELGKKFCRECGTRLPAPPPPPPSAAPKPQPAPPPDDASESAKPRESAPRPPSPSPSSEPPSPAAPPGPASTTGGPPSSRGPAREPVSQKPPEPVRKRRRGAMWIGVAVLVVTVLGAVVLLAVSRFPGYLGLAAREGATVTATTSMPDPTSAAGDAVAVVTGTPRSPATEAPRPTPTEARGEMPAVVGLGRDEATDLLIAIAPSLELVETETTDPAGHDRVISQRPDPGSPVADGVAIEVGVYVTPESSATPLPPDAGAKMTRDTDGATLVYVPSGTFTMGSTDVQLDITLALCARYYGDCELAWWENEQPAHTVTLDGYWIDQTEVTNGQFRACVKAGECAPPNETHSAMVDEYYGVAKYDDYPVIYVSWNQANAYCRWAGARLPTEAEWEYTARGTEEQVFPWGSAFDGERLNYCDADCPVGKPDESVADGFREVGEVSSYPDGASWVGALDLAGNVWEYVWDWYGSYAPEAVNNPRGPDSGENKVMRGGAWDTTPDSTRATNRYGIPIEGWNYAVGFRCAMDP